MKRLVLLVRACVFALAIFPSTFAFAEQSRGFYMGVGFGDAQADLSAGDLNQLFREAFSAQGATFSPQTSSVDNKDSSVYVFAGYRIFPYLSAEAGYVNSGSIDYASSGTLYSFSGIQQIATHMQIESQGVAASALGHLPLSDSFEIHGRLGFYIVSTNVDITGGSASRSANSSDSGVSFAPQVGLGAGVNLGAHFSLTADWVYFFGIDSNSSEEQSNSSYDGFNVNILRLSAIARF